MTVEKIILFGFAAICLGFGIFLDRTALIALAGILMIVGAVGPETIKKLVLKFIGGHEISLERYDSPKSETEKAINFVEDEERPSIAEEPLVKSAVQRRDEERSPTDFLLLATNAWKEKQFEEGLGYGYAGLALKPEDVRIKASLELQNGLLYANIGEINQAIVQFKKAIQTDPLYFSPHNNLGVMLKDQGEFEEAEKGFRKAIELDPKNEVPHNNLGIMLKGQDKFEEAKQCFKKAIELNPKYSSPHNNLGNLLKDRGKSEDAVKAYRKAIELNPEFADAHYNLGLLLKDQGKTDESEKCFRKAIEYNPKHADALTNLFILLHDQSNHG